MYCTKAIAIAVICLFNSALLYGQSLSSAQLSFSGGAIPVEEFIDSVQTVRGLTVSYSPDILGSGKKITVPKKEVSLEKALLLASSDGAFAYTLDGSTLILRSTENAGETAEKQPIVETVSGYVKDSANGEVLIGANVYIQETMKGTITNLYGYFSIPANCGDCHLVVNFLGYKDYVIPVSSIKNGRVTINLSSSSETIETVTVTGERSNENVVTTEVSAVKLNSATIKKVPVMFGEVDLMKVLKLMPGVQPTSEVSSGMSVRGGAQDHNKVLLDEAPVYNASHLMGFFSVFNNDAVKSVKMYKGGIPAQYGGRLASVTDVRMKDGNMKKFSGNGGIGLISSRLTLEAPIVKDKASVLVSGRRTYADVFTLFSRDETVKKSTLYFYDLNAKANVILNDNNRLYLSGYSGRDFFGSQAGSDMNFDWGNRTATLRWNHLFSSRLFSNLSLIYSRYNYGLGMTFDYGEPGDKKSIEFDWGSQLQDYALKYDLTYFANEKNNLKFGAEVTRHSFQPGNVSGRFDTTSFRFDIAEYRALETGLYVSNEYKMTKKLSVEYGLRFSMFQNIGPGVVYFFDEDNDYSIKDSAKYSSNDVYNTYPALEPRLSGTYVLNDVSSVKLTYNRMVQYVHLMSSSRAGMPLDVWVPSGKNIKPQVANQVSLGYFRNFFENKLEASAEVYYKLMDNTVGFRDHAQLLMNPYVESQVRTGEGKAYGIEFLLRKTYGKLSGWLSYTLSRTIITIPTVNNGESYLSNYDRPHNLALVGMYDVSKRISLAANFVYMTGQAFSAPAGKAYIDGVAYPVYTGRNGDRMPDYHRMDLSIVLKGKEKPGRKWEGEWNFSVYNLYFRKNATSIRFEAQEDGTMQAYKTWVMPVMPSVSYNFKF